MFNDRAAELAKPEGALGISQAKSSPCHGLRVLHIAETAKGGVGTYLDEMARFQLSAFGKSGVRVIVPDEHRAQLATVPDAIITPFKRRGRTARSLANLVRTTLREVRIFQPDLIHAHSTFAGLLVRLLFGWRALRPGLIYCPHGWSFDRPGHRFMNEVYRKIERALMGFSDRVIAVSAHESAIAAALGARPDQKRTIVNGIAEAPPRVAPFVWNDSRLKVLFVGRLDAAKGFDVLIEAIEGLEDRVCVNVAGEAVVEKVQNPKDCPHVRYLGWLSQAEIAGVLAAADIVVIPSRNEAFGLVALEAMRAEKMVVASAVGGLVEIVVDGVTGRLVPPDDPQALRKVLLMDGPDARAEMGRRGRAHFMTHFSSSRMHSDILDVYNETLAERKTAISAASGH